MSLTEHSREILRLIKAFETEAGKFHDISFHTYPITQHGCSDIERKFYQPNHTIIMWQYYGLLGSDADRERLVKNVGDSDMQWGLRGSALSLIGVIEGDATPLFVRMAKRAAQLFTEEDSRFLKSRVVSEIQESEKQANAGKPVAAVNDAPLAIWLNFLLYHLSLTGRGRDRAQRIEPDPFSLSLLALERLQSDGSVGKIDRSATPLASVKFRVAVSFPGEHRTYVAAVVEALREPLGPDGVFYDFDYQAQLARPNLDTFLQGVYRTQADLIVVFLAEAYAEKEWCGLEWRAIRDIIKSKEDERVMFVRMDEGEVGGHFSIDGYIDGRSNDPDTVAEHILTRLSVLTNTA